MALGHVRDDQRQRVLRLDSADQGDAHHDRDERPAEVEGGLTEQRD
jgi:hypothetical protein